MVKIYALCCGCLEFDRKLFFPESDRGIAMTVPVPSYLIVHPKGKVLFDTGLHCDATRDPVGRLGENVAKYTIACAPGATRTLSTRWHCWGFAPRTSPTSSIRTFISTTAAAMRSSPTHDSWCSTTNCRPHIAWTANTMARIGITRSITERFTVSAIYSATVPW